MTEKKPDDPSSDHMAMKPYWEMVTTILGGAAAMRAKGEVYLPKFPDEKQEKYDFRRKHAKFTNIYRDIVENLAQRPFGKQVELSSEGVSPELLEFAEDVDGRGNHIHVFAGEVFFAGINAAIDWILVDYTKDVPDGATKAQESEIGARPFWVRYDAASVIAAYSDMIGDREEFVHVRLLEPEIEREGFGENAKSRVRILNRESLDGGGYGPATYEVVEEREGKDGKKEWVSIEGPAPISIGIIPLVPFLTGRRIGTSWKLQPPMRDAADLQVEHYQQESALKYAKEMTSFPMLAGNGVTPAVGKDGKPQAVPVGPHAVLYAPMSSDGKHGVWQFIEPDATSLKFLAEDIKETARELRELGRQPLTAQSGNLTVVTTAFAAEKGNAAIQAWVLNLKDALENALRFTSMWLKKEESATEVMVDTDFDLGWGVEDTFGHVMVMKNTGTISRRAAITEAKRRSILSADYDAEEDEEFIEADLMPGSEPGSSDDE